MKRLLKVNTRFLLINFTLELVTVNTNLDMVTDLTEHRGEDYKDHKDHKDQDWKLLSCSPLSPAHCLQYQSETAPGSLSGWCGIL